MKINVFLVCYNEAVLLPNTVKHYRSLLPSCSITIYDNESTDNSVELAKSLGCTVINWDTGNRIDDHKLRDLKNTCWKSITDGWIIMADMDEWLCVSESDLQDEFNNGTTILNVRGVNMIGESKLTDLSDIDLFSLEKLKHFQNESKKLCFLRESINDIEYTNGAHWCFPKGTIKYSLKTYINKHMHFLGLNFLIDKYTKCYHRSHEMRKENMAIHYTDNVERITSAYMEKLNGSYTMDLLPNITWSYYNGLDSGGNDIKCVGRLPLEALIKAAEDTPGCVAFNTLGYLKSDYTLNLASTPWIKAISEHGVYIKNIYNKLSNGFTYIDENNYLIDHISIENTEQLQANTFIRPDSVVLELGARYGTVSCVINSKLNNKKNQVSVEPDSRVWKALEKNMIRNNCNFNILKGVISNSPLELTNLSYNYGTTSVKSTSSAIPNYTLKEVEGLYDLKFNTLVADCEGFLESFMDDNPQLYDELTLIMFEKDYQDKCNYGKIMNNLRAHGFKNLISGFHEVWRK
jgi:FkbM family methyltransferase